MSAPITAAPRVRHALGLPAGSVRSILAFGILGMIWCLALLYRGKELPMVFIYLQFLMILILAHFFAADGHTIGTPDSYGPLYLPSSWVRFLLMIGYGGMAYFLFHTRPDFEMPQKGDWLFLIALVLTTFFLGHIFTMCLKFVNRGKLPPWYQDIEAWLALIAVILMVILVFTYLINSSLDNRIDNATLDAILAAIVGFYFGSRS